MTQNYIAPNITLSKSHSSLFGPVSDRLAWCSHFYCSRWHLFSLSKQELSAMSS